MDEKRKLNTELNILRTENQTSDRTIKQQKHFNSKRDKAHKEMQEEAERNAEEIAMLNKRILDLTWAKDVEKRKLNDKNVVKEQNGRTMQLSAEYNAVEIDINIAKSRISELSGKKDQALKEIEDILMEKRVIDREN